ncbi:MAG: hypothetical protein KGM47_17190 [Acidobacteriota bacterium]|nr:hypothetical protein [Acidobacteriota bacterium]
MSNVSKCGANRIPFYLLAACFASASLAPAQTKTTPKASHSACAPSGKTKSSNTACLKLLSLGPVDPANLARTMPPPASTKAPQASSSRASVVTEFHAAPTSTALSMSGLNVNEPKKKILKDVHGEIYGAGAAGGHAEGAAVGATSKSGKIHVFVETGHNSVQR